MSKIGILDPDGINLNPLTNKIYSDIYKEQSSKWKLYPAYSDPEKTIDIIKKNQIILITSGTGSGKTVLMPKFCLHVLEYKGKIAITLPKQMIAKSAAEFAALTLDVDLGTFVGYQYRGSEKSAKSDKSNLLYVTDGTLVSRLIKDPLLTDFDIVIIDEAHERKVQIDFLLYLLRNVIMKRKEFKIVIMSATINIDIFKDYFASFKFKHLDIGGKTNYPITSIFLQNESDKNIEYKSKGLDIIKKIIRSDDITLPGAHDILFFITSISETTTICYLIIVIV